MTPRLKGLRGQPLLEPPRLDDSLTEWARTSQSDREIIEAAVDNLRADSGTGRVAAGGDYAPLLDRAISVGISVPTGKEDVRRSVDDFEVIRKAAEQTPVRLLQYAWHMRNLGIGVELSGEEKAAARRFLGMRNHFVQRGQTALAHVYASGLGVNEALGKDGLAFTMAHLEESRRMGDAYSLNWTHWALRGLGHRPEMTEADLGLIRGELEERRRQGDGLIVVGLLYYLQGTLRADPGVDEAAGHPLPGLKRYGR